jgi:hypothetical protein
VSPLSLQVAFYIGSTSHSLLISVLENGELNVDTEEEMKDRVIGLIEGAGIGVAIEILRKQLQ